MINRGIFHVAASASFLALAGVEHIMTRAGENDIVPEYEKIVAVWLSAKIRYRETGG